jgi:hypothetical protein
VSHLAEADTATDTAIVTAQIGREPRAPWSVAVRCSHGFASVIASPSVLADGTPFPTHLWLTCPHVASAASAAESRGETAAWAARLASDAALAGGVRAADAQLRALRAEASGGADACAAVGVAGQREPLATKCIHAHAALALAGVADPVGRELLAECGDACQDARCARLATGGAR